MRFHSTILQLSSIAQRTISEADENGDGTITFDEFCKVSSEWCWIGFVLFNNTWSQWGHSVSCMIIHFFSKLANHQIRHQATHQVDGQLGDCIWSVTLIFLRGLCGYIWVNILTLSPLRAEWCRKGMASCNILFSGHAVGWLTVPSWLFTGYQ